jgi:hypothetical protein
MSPFQMTMLALGVLLGVSTYWDQIKTLIKTLIKPNKVNPDLTPDPNVIEGIVDTILIDTGTTILEDPKKPDRRHDPLDSLAEVVVCWEHLQDELKKRGLNKAAAELTSIFPLFIEAAKEDEVKPQSGA